MKRATILYFLYFLAVLPLPAQSRGFSRDAAWWAGEGAILASTTVDAQSTCLVFARGYVEGGLIGRGNKSCVNTAANTFGEDVGYTVAHLLAHKYLTQRKSRALRVLGYVAVPVAAGLMNGWGASHNYSLPNRKR